MRTPKFSVSKLFTAVAVTLLVSACGGGGEDDDANENADDSVTYVLAGTATPNAATGKTLYASSCASCHGANFPNARDSTRTLAAIASNKGGMGYLSATIKTQQSDDIAVYLSTL